MKRVFADTHFYVALLNRGDPAHQRTVSLLANDGIERIVTTGWVLAEVANSLSKSRHRVECGRFLANLMLSGNTHVVALSDNLQSRGLELFIRRSDKDWSLTDCISFIVMADEKLAEALTADHHFVQAGFVALLA